MSEIVSAQYLRIEDAGGLILAPDWPAVASLHTAINAAISAMPVVPLDRVHDYDKYRYQSIFAVSNALRQALKSAGLAITMNVESISESPGQTSTGKAQNTATVMLAITLADCATGAMKIVRWPATGADRGERAAQKAITTAFKGWIRSQFLASDQDDDPDGDRKSQSQPTQEEPEQPPMPEDEPQPAPAGTTHRAAPVAWGEDDKRAKAAFLAWCTNAAKAHQCTLTYEQIKQILSVAHLADYSGTYTQAQATVIAALKKAQPQDVPANGK